MKLERALDAFLERSEPDIAMGGKTLSKPDIAENVSKALEADLVAVQASATRWRVAILLALCGLATSSFLADGAWKALSFASAGGFIAALHALSRRKLAVDLCIALLRAADNGEQRVKVIQAIRSQL